MKDLFDKIPNAKELSVKCDSDKTDKEKLLEEQTEFIAKEIGSLNSTNNLVLNFPIISELTHILYRKGYNVVVNGNESVITIRDPKEDMFDEWTTFDCGN